MGLIIPSKYRALESLIGNTDTVVHMRICGYEDRRIGGLGIHCQDSFKAMKVVQRLYPNTYASVRRTG